MATQKAAQGGQGLKSPAAAQRQAETQRANTQATAKFQAAVNPQSSNKKPDRSSQKGKRSSRTHSTVEATIYGKHEP